MSGENRILGRVPVKRNPRIHRVVVASADGSRFGLYEESDGHLLRWLIDMTPFSMALEVAAGVAAGSQHEMTAPRTTLGLAACVLALLSMGPEGAAQPELEAMIGEAA